MIQIHTNNPLFEPVRQFCLSLPFVTEDIKWEKDLVFSVHNKMFYVTMTEEPFTLSFKCSPQDTELLVQKKGIIPAPYLARYDWVQCENLKTLSFKELQKRIQNSYQLVWDKLPAKLKKVNQ
ncbi:PF04237 family protein [Leptospira interrogans serovar Bataviae str. L1111]|uniref:MmcQ/YjbR family DNA-binding protein n=1 Tax=Leptospira interrogans TaxID=173 RepID=UPI00029741DD|nr:MmcQ/YjbR family DNA-binding protein [Leptospira interrogans]EKR24916.1 PF04237 family protein [Leptospira interrogans serovar Bataviae str. L1111]